MDKVAPTAQWLNPADRGGVLGRFSLAVDPSTGHLIPVPGLGDLTLRFDEDSGHLVASDDDEMPAARTVVIDDRAQVY